MLITNYSIRFRTAVFVFAVLLVVSGAWSYLRLPREGAPDITFPFVAVTSIYEGSAPEEIENLITIPMEKQFNNLPNVKEISSVSAESVSTVTIEFTPAQDIDLALQKIRDKIDLARPDLPSDLDEPIVRDFNASTDEPVFAFTLSGGGSLERLKRIAEQLEDGIERLPGVLQANVYGLPEREIRVSVAAERLDGLGLSFGEVIGEAASVFWNGPMGVFEWEAFRSGTAGIAAAVASSDGYTVVGGGDSVAALRLLERDHEVSFVSSGGGAGLQMLEGKTLPGIAVLERWS